jgi:hypothetical protein
MIQHFYHIWVRLQCLFYFFKYLFSSFSMHCNFFFYWKADMLYEVKGTQCRGSWSLCLFTCLSNLEGLPYNLNPLIILEELSIPTLLSFFYYVDGTSKLSACCTETRNVFIPSVPKSIPPSDMCLHHFLQHLDDSVNSTMSCRFSWGLFPLTKFPLTPCLGLLMPLLHLNWRWCNRHSSL